jgi:hypothetical protein
MSGSIRVVHRVRPEPAGRATSAFAENPDRPRIRSTSANRTRMARQGRSRRCQIQQRRYRRGLRDRVQRDPVRAAREPCPSRNWLGPRAPELRMRFAVRHSQVPPFVRRVPAPPWMLASQTESDFPIQAAARWVAGPTRPPARPTCLSRISRALLSVDRRESPGPALKLCSP